MTEKRFYLLKYNNYPIYDSLNDKEYNAQFKAQREKLCLLLNELNNENEGVKQYIKQVLQNHLNSWRGVYNPIDENEVIEISIVKSIAKDLGVDLE